MSTYSLFLYIYNIYIPSLYTCLLVRTAIEGRIQGHRWSPPGPWQRDQRWVEKGDGEKSPFRPVGEDHLLRVMPKNPKVQPKKNVKDVQPSVIQQFLVALFSQHLGLACLRSEGWSVPGRQSVVEDVMIWLMMLKIYYLQVTAPPCFAYAHDLHVPTMNQSWDGCLIRWFRWLVQCCSCRCY